ncbi:MAG: mannitol-1-phosphate 5-dehydrogenase [Spirochaetaceae bacterium]
MKEKELLVQFGAGNIGRSFLGQIFARNGWEVLFVDVDEMLLETLNRERRYTVVVKDPDGSEERLTISGVRAVDARDRDAVARELARTAYVATSVGSGAIRRVIPHLASECVRRHREEPQRRPFDLILAENIHNGSTLVEELLLSALPAETDRSLLPGIIECSVGKMVPLLPEALRKSEPTTVFAERYNSLILDKKAWKNPIPPIPELVPVDNIAAYVDRKLFIHNLGHAATAYLGYISHPEATYLWELLEDPEVISKTRSAMGCAAEALLRAYPESFSREQLAEHIEDLLYRFRNRALGDTVHRVGRDLKRKLAGEDRVVGAMRLAERWGVDPDPIVAVYRSALQFKAPDEKGELFPADAEFHRELEERGVEYALREISGLEPGESLYETVNSRLP